MKKVFLLSIMLIASMLIFPSCDKDWGKSVDYSIIIGSWSESYEEQGDYVSVNFEVIWTFKRDKTSSERIVLTMNDIIMKDTSVFYNYVYNGKSIIFTNEKGGTFEYEVNVSGDTMILGNSEAGYFHLTRKK